MAQVFVGDVGTEIILDCGVDITGATVCRIVVRKQNGKRVDWFASIHEETSIKYVTKDGDIDVPGTWRIQAYVEMPGWKGRGEVAELTVKNTL